MVVAPKTEDVVRVLDDNGDVIAGAQVPQIEKADLEKVYRNMMVVRILDERMLRLQRTGQLGFYMTSTGEEATHMAVQALGESDWVYPSYREPGAAFYRGYSIYEFICQLYGNSDDLVKGRQMPVHHSCKRINFVSISSPVGTQIPQATGTAMAAKITGKKDVTICYFGEGTSSASDFHVGLNFAGVYKAPVIFILRNNGWAISVPQSRQTAAKTFAARGVGYGMPGIRVDGNDVLAMLKVTQDAVARARAGDGPTLIEACTYRMGGHSSSDDPSAYRDAAEPEIWAKKDPIQRFRAYLRKQGVWTEEMEHKFEAEITAEIVDATKRAQALGAPALETMFDDVYEKLPRHLAEQKDWLLSQKRTKNPHAH